jgi:branched-chain amino acid transport system ATP-binding protein
VVTGRHEGELGEEAQELLAEIHDAEESSIAEAEGENK